MNAKNDLDVCASKNTHIYILVHAKFIALEFCEGVNEKLIFVR